MPIPTHFTLTKTSIPASLSTKRQTKALIAAEETLLARREERELSDAKSTITDLENQLEDYRKCKTELEGLRVQLSHQRKKVTSLEKDLSSREESLATLRSHFKNNKTSSTTISTEVSEQAELDAASQGYKSALDSKGAELDKALGQMEQLRIQIITLEEASRIYRMRIDQLEKLGKKDLEEREVALMESVTNLQKEKVEAAELIVDLQGQRDVLKERLKQSGEKNVQLDQERTKVHTTNKALQKENTRLEALHIEGKGVVEATKRAKDEIRSLKGQLDRSEEQVKELQKSRSVENDLVAVVAALKQETEKQKGQLAAQKENYEGRLTKMQAKHAAALKKEGEVKTHNEAFIKPLNDTIEGLRKELKEVKNLNRTKIAREAADFVQTYIETLAVDGVERRDLFGRLHSKNNAGNLGCAVVFSLLEGSKQALSDTDAVLRMFLEVDAEQVVTATSEVHRCATDLNRSFQKSVGDLTEGMSRTIDGLEKDLKVAREVVICSEKESAKKLKAVEKEAKDAGERVKELEQELQKRSLAHSLVVPSPTRSSTPSQARSTTSSARGSTRAGNSMLFQEVKSLNDTVLELRNTNTELLLILAGGETA